MRRHCNLVKIGTLEMGGGSPVTVQSMLKLPPSDISGNIAQALQLQMAGCDIIRIAIPGHDAVPLIAALKEKVAMPVVADIHFDYRLALESVAAGVDKIRLNPGNIGDSSRVGAVADACRRKNIPIRIGVNAGSVEKEILARHGGPTPQAMAESALYHAGLLEEFDFTDIVVSVKSNNIRDTIQANRILAESCPYPLHLGLTHTGVMRLGLVSSAVGIGSLLAAGIGDSIRYSLAGPPEEEVKAAKDLLRVLGLGKTAPDIIACPTCGRCQADIIHMTELVSNALEDCSLPVTVAVMGCEVNGPGEAREADIAVIGGKHYCALYQKGKLVGKVPESETVPALLSLIEDYGRGMEENQ